MCKCPKIPSKGTVMKGDLQCMSIKKKEKAQMGNNLKQLNYVSPESRHT